MALTQLVAYGASDIWLHVNNENWAMPYNWPDIAEYYQISKADGRGEMNDPENWKDVHNINSFMAIEPCVQTANNFELMRSGKWSDQQCNILDHVGESDRPGKNVTKPFKVRDQPRKSVGIKR